MKNQWDFIPELMKLFKLSNFCSKYILTVVVTAGLSFTSSLVNSSQPLKKPYISVLHQYLQGQPQ